MLIINFLRKIIQHLFVRFQFVTLSFCILGRPFPGGPRLRGAYLQGPVHGSQRNVACEKMSGRNLRLPQQESRVLAGNASMPGLRDVVAGKHERIRPFSISVSTMRIVLAENSRKILLGDNLSPV